MDIIRKIKEKKEFSGLPDSLIEKVLNQKGIKNKTEDEKVKLTRAFLRKYFGVFLTNKVLKGKDKSVLESHISSKKRDYSQFYEKISLMVGTDFKSVVDLGCGMNGFSYAYMSKVFGNIDYVGIESTRQLCDLQNDYFTKNDFGNAKVIWGDLFNLDEVKSLIKERRSPRLILLLQVVDALENVEPNFSKVFLDSLKSYIGKEDVLIISNPLSSISGRNKFTIKRRWLEEFIEQNFKILGKFDLFNEEFFAAKLL